jgi:hypothetical protein
VSLTGAFDLTTPTGRAMAGLLGVFAEFEREILSPAPNETITGGTLVLETSAPACLGTTKCYVDGDPTPVASGTGNLATTVPVAIGDHTIVRGDDDARVQREAFAPRAEPLDAADGRTCLRRRAPGSGCVGLHLCEHVGTCGLVDAIGVRGPGEPAGNPPQQAIEDREHLGVGGDRQELEAQAVRVVVDEDAVGDDEVEVNVEIHQPAEALHEGLHVAHGIGFGAGLAQYVRKPDWSSDPERIPPKKVVLRAV